MAILSIIHQQKGPLPITAKFQSPTSGPACIVVNGSVWTQTANQIIGIQIQLDSKVIGTAEIFSNLAATHRAVVASYIPVQLPVQTTHTLTLTVLNSHTVSDFNDFFEVVLDY